MLGMRRFHVPMGELLIGDSIYVAVVHKVGKVHKELALDKTPILIRH